MSKIIKLTRGKVALVDDEDYERLRCYKWHAWSNPPRNKSWYAKRTVYLGDYRTMSIFMHREILGLGSNDPEVDHRDGDGLNNRRNNLRIATCSENRSNRVRAEQSTAPYKGITRHGNKWRARIGINGTRIHLGTFESAEEAAKTYDEAAKRIHMEFARLNFT